MEPTVRMPLRALDPALVKELQDKYPGADLYIVTTEAMQEASAMDEGKFWDAIALLDWSKAGNDDAVIEPVVRELSKMPESAILAFYDLLSEKLYLLDGRAYAEHSISNDAGISSDLFLYARCAVVANGRAFFEAVLKNPDQFPKNRFFEALLNIPEHAWLRKTGRHLDHLPKYLYETGFNPNGWGADTISL